MVRIVEFPGEAPEPAEGLCVHPDDPPRMLAVMTPYMDIRKRWLRGMAEKGLWIAVAVGADGERRGMIECVPVEWAAEPVDGEGSLFINCLWVLPRYSKAGVGTALMEYVITHARNDGKARGAGGITVLAHEKDRWFGYFSYMPAGFFRRFGFSEVDRDGSRVLLHLDLGGARRPSLLHPGTRADVVGASTRHVVEVLYSSQCPWSGWMIDGIRDHIAKLDVEVRLVNTDDRAAVEEYGMTRGVCVDGQPLIARLASGREVARAVKQRLSVPFEPG